MDESILESIKAMLGGNLSGDDTTFDSQIMPIINMALNTLTQIGAGPSQGFNITSKDDVWSDFVGGDEMLYGLVTQYVLLKVKLVWDSSSMTGAVIDIMKEQAKELESRISYRVDPSTTF